MRETVSWTWEGAVVEFGAGEGEVCEGTVAGRVEGCEPSVGRGGGGATSGGVEVGKVLEGGEG